MTTAAPAFPPPALISVVMPVLDEEAHVEAQLAALAGQTYSDPWELVVADNGCTDRTLEIVRSWADRVPALTIVDATRRPGSNHARNAGAAAARGDFLAFCDADDVASPDWLAAMARAARHADIVGGCLEYEALNSSLVRAWRKSRPMIGLRYDDHGFLRYAPGGNLGVWARVAGAVGWDERFTVGSCDHVFTWRAQLQGFRLEYAPDAVVHQRFRTTLGAMARQHYRYGKSGPHLYRAFRADGIPPPDNRAALRKWRKLIAEVPRLHRSTELRGAWLRLVSFRLGRIVGSIQARVICL